jgi:microcystin-dependent protein
MSYQVKFSDTTKTPITVDDQTLNQDRSVAFVGKNYAGYSQAIAENFLHLLENFANSSQPKNPVTGQLWYDTTIGENNQLKLFDGAKWIAAGNVKKATSAPLTSVIGDLWVDTDNQQLFLYNGTSWILVGPQYSTGQKTGAEVELISDTFGDEVRPIVTLFVKDERVAIISERQFTPKSALEGFTTLKQGINLSTKNFNSTALGNKFWGVAEKADALVIGSAAVAASNFLRSDQISTTNFGLNVRNNSGVSIGDDLSLSIGIDSNSAVLYNKISGSSIDFKLRSSAGITTVLRVDSSQRVGINKTNPDESLDVVGNIKTNGQIIVTNTQNASDINTGSIRTVGGASINKKLFIGEELEVNGNSILKNTLPKTDNGFNLGSSTVRWGNIFANRVGQPENELAGKPATTFFGNFNGFLTGNISGNASGLTSTTVFSLGDRLNPDGSVAQTSDVVSAGINFNGSTTTNNVTLTGIISPSFITNKPQSTDSQAGDEFLMSRAGILSRVSKSTFLRNVPLVPTGAIFPFAGAVPPIGYLLCDGSEQQIASYPELFAVIEYRYKPLSLLIGVATFGLPDLRGRFPLGRDNMSNSGTVPGVNRVPDVAADELGGVGGVAEVQLVRNNLPEHVHNLKGNAGSQFYAFRPATGSPPDTNAESANGLTATGQGQLMVDSGGVFMDDLPSSSLAVPFTVTNNYQTLNYIIFTGRIA